MRPRIPTALRHFCVGLLLLQTLSGCTTSEIIQQTSQAADQTVFNKKNSAVETDWGPPWNDPHVAGYVKGILNRIAAHAKTPGGYSLTITQGALVNGSSELGGIITVTRGMLNAATNEAELAAYLGHEIGHIDLGHGAYHAGFLYQSLNRGVDYLADKTGTYGEVSTAQSQTNDIIAARHSQNQEQAADEYGAVLAAKAGYNPYGLVHLFERLAARVNANPIYRIAKLKGSHKALDVRAHHLRAYLAEKGYKDQGEEDAARYARLLTALWTYGGRSGPATKAPPEAYQQLQQIHEELIKYRASKKPLPMARYIAIMRQFSAWKRQYGGAPTSRQAWLPFRNWPRAFMEEAISQGTPLFSSPGDPDFNNKVDADLSLIGHLAVGLFPPAAAGVGLYETITGDDFFTGQSLSDGQRAFAALNTVLGGLATVGAIAEMAPAFEAAFSETVSAGEISSEAAQMGEVAANTAVAVSEAIESGGIVLGENMADRVGPAASQIGAGVYDPPPADPTDWMSNNQQWLQDQMNSGRPSYDTDIDPGRGNRSDYYQMEQQTLTDAGYTKEYVKDISITAPDGTNSTVKLYKWGKS